MNGYLGRIKVALMMAFAKRNGLSVWRPTVSAAPANGVVCLRRAGLMHPEVKTDSARQIVDGLDVIRVFTRR